MVAYDLPKATEDNKIVIPIHQYLLKNFLRVQVNYDIRKPLYQEIPLEVELQDGSIVNQLARLAYEALPECCFCCGILGHSFKACKYYNGSWKIDDLPYKESIRATSVVANIPKSFRNIPRGPKFFNRSPVKKEPLTPVYKKQRVEVKKISPSEVVVSEAVENPKESSHVLVPAAPASVPSNHSLSIPNTTPSMSFMPQPSESAFSGNFGQSPLNPPMPPGMMIPQQNLFRGYASPYQPMFQQQNPYLQFGSFSPSHWAPNMNFVDPNVGFFQPHVQAIHTPIPPTFTINPLHTGPMEVNKPQVDLTNNPDLATLHNIVNGKPSFFAPLQKSTPIPASRTKQRANTASPINIKAPEVDQKTRVQPPRGQIRTRSAGK